MKNEAYQKPKIIRLSEKRMSKNTCMRKKNSCTWK